ncbi:GTPase, partial [Escherichia albertii]|uniref:GTPase n=1 Tax=Escherichia albertii TaxID=208962 RepID=UPI0030C91215
MNPSDAIEAIEKPLSSLPYSLSRHILEHLRKLTSHEPVIGIMGKSGAGKSSLCNALFHGEVTPVSDVHAGTREVRRSRAGTVRDDAGSLGGYLNLVHTSSGLWADIVAQGTR